MTQPKTYVQDLPELTLIGLGADFISNLYPKSNAMDVIPPLWNRFFGQLAELEGINATWMVGAMGHAKKPTGEPGEMSYFAGARVQEVPSDVGPLKTLVIPAGRYAICEHVGSVANLVATNEYFYKRWLPESGLTWRDGYDLEIYDERFNDTDDSILLICCPIEEGDAD